MGLEWVSSRGKAIPSSYALAGRQAGTLAGSRGGGHPAPEFFNCHRSATHGTDRFGRYFAPLQTLGDVTNSPGGEPARCLGSQRSMAPTGTRRAFVPGAHQPEYFAEARRNGQLFHSNGGEWASTTCYVQPAHGDHEYLRPGEYLVLEDVQSPAYERARGQSRRHVSASSRRGRSGAAYSDAAWRSPIR